MVKRSFCALALVGMLSTVAMAGEADFELLWNGHSGQLGDPVQIEPGVATPLVLSLRNNTGTELSIGGVVLDFESPTGEILFDYDGPDDMSPPVFPAPDRAAMADDGWQWGGPMGTPFNADGSAGDPYPLLAGGVSRPFGDQVPFFAVLHDTWSNNPPQTAYSNSDASFAVKLPGGETMELGTLMITAELAAGPGGSDVPLNVLDAEGNLGGKVFDLAGFSFEDVNADNNQTVHLNVVPEPATAALLAIGGLLGLRRRRRA